MSERSTTHATFTVERHYESEPEVVFAAFSDPEKKRRWFAAGERSTVDDYTMDFSVGGFEKSRFRFKDGSSMTNDTVFMDIVENVRIISAYWMTVDGEPISASLSTIEFKPEKNGTRLIFTEQATFLDGKDQAEQREGGTRWLLEQLAAFLAKSVS